jgi:hypothetical protein
MSAGRKFFLFRILRFNRLKGKILGPDPHPQTSSIQELAKDTRGGGGGGAKLTPGQFTPGMRGAGQNKCSP